MPPPSHLPFPRVMGINSSLYYKKKEKITLINILMQ